jgi:hypothetical protein
VKLEKLKPISSQTIQQNSFMAIVRFKDYDFEVWIEKKIIFTKISTHTEYDCKIRWNSGQPNLTKGQKSRIYELIAENI